MIYMCAPLSALGPTWSLQEGYTLDEGVVQAAVKACCRAGRPSEAEAILAKSLERGVVPEVGWFSLLGQKLQRIYVERY